MGALIAILLIGAGLWISSDIPVDTEEPKQTQDVQVSQQKHDMMMLDSYPITTIDANDWLHKYAKNMWKQKTVFKMQEDFKKGQFIKLTGEIHGIRNNLIEGTNVTFLNEKGWCKIICSFYNDEQIEKLIDNYKVGDKITIIGYSKWVVGPELINCYIKD